MSNKKKLAASAATCIVSIVGWVSGIFEKPVKCFLHTESEEICQSISTKRDLDLIVENQENMPVKDVDVTLIDQGSPKHKITDGNGFVRFEIVKKVDLIMTFKKSEIVPYKHTIKSENLTQGVTTIKVTEKGMVKDTTEVESKGLTMMQQPSNGEKVSREVDASGTLANLAEGDSLWVYVYPSADKRYYPSEVKDINSNTWRTSLLVGLDDKKASGGSFEIGIFTANSKLNEQLSHSSNSGTATLPKGIKRFNSLKVTRK
jgi:hypothetical protein